MRETTLAEFHGSDEKNRLGTFSSSPVPSIVETVRRNALF